MLVVRGTKKLRDRVKAPTIGEATSTGLLGDWFATALFWRPQVALVVNARTFLPVFMPLAPAPKLLDRLPDEIARVLKIPIGTVRSRIARGRAALLEELS